MKKQFVISDTHFGHANILTFTGKDGSRIRHFNTVEEMDNTMIDNWNNVVSPEDTVYHLGDVVINRKALPTLYRLNGRKILIKGNHDIFKLKDYLPYFEDIRAYKVVANKSTNNKFVLSHIPVHLTTFDRWKGGNIHGHTHEKRVLNKHGKIDTNYYCVSVEQIDYTPMLLETAMENLITQ